MDPVLKEWLNERGIPAVALEIAGCRYDAGVLSWPRYRLSGGEIAGWKHRDLRNGRFWGSPAGISHADTQPLCIKDVVPASGVMICEGESDAMRLACTDLPGLYSCDVMCIPGATAFPANWAPLLREYDRVHVFADADDAGRALPDRLANLVPGTRCVRLPDGHDVCSFLLEHSEEDLTRLYTIAPLHVAEPAPIRRQNFQWDDAAARDHRDKLVRIILADGVRLQRRGANEFVGLCPFHNESTPSFSVNPGKGLYRCFGCDAKGDIISYLKAKRDFSFGEAMRYLESY